MTRKVINDLVLAQVFLFGGMLPCVALRPAGLGANDGISYYGIHPLTVAPYAVAIGGSALFTRRALRALAPGLPAPAYVARMADGLALMSGGVVLTPYSANALFDWAHTLLGTVVFFCQLVLAVQLLAWSGGDGWIAWLLAAQFTAGVIAAIYVLPEDGFLIQAQLGFQLAFGGLLARTAHLLRPRLEPAYAE